MLLRELKDIHARDYLWEFDLRADEEDVWWLFGYGEYPPSSVIAGQYRVARLEWFQSKEEAIKNYPDVLIVDALPTRANLIAPRVPDVPPNDFNPADAGETWEED